MVQRLQKQILVVIISFFLAACSLKTLYNHLDTLLVEWVEGMVTLDEPMYTEVERRAASLLAWHRKEQLEDYVRQMTAWKRSFGPDIEEKKVAAFIEDVRTSWRVVVEQLEHDMAALLPSLNGKQQDELNASIQEKNREFREKYAELSDVEKRERYMEISRDIFSEWLGELTPPQRALIRVASQRFISSTRARLEARIRWQQHIDSILRSDASASLKSRRLKQYFAGFHLNELPDVRSAYEHNSTVATWLVTEIVRASTPEQRRHFRIRVDDYIRIFRELGAEV